MSENGNEVIVSESNLDSPELPPALPEEIPLEGEDVAQVMETVQMVVLEDRPFMSTPFEDYTVTEGLLLVIFVILLIDVVSNFFRRWI